MTMRKSTAVATTAALMLSTASARAEPIDVAAFATIDVAPRFTTSTIGFSELEAGPGAVRDGDATTAWIVPADPAAIGALTFDWSGWGVAPFVLPELRVDLVPADAAIEIDTGIDAASLAPTTATIARDANGVTLTFVNGAPLRMLRIRAPGGTRIVAIRANASPGGTLAGAPTATCDADGVHLGVATNALLALKVTRALSTGGALTFTRRRLDGSPITDASVRFEARPATYAYTVTPLGSDAAPATVSVTCNGAALSRPPSTAIHGVIEGFYGRPWTWGEREKIVRAMGALGLDTYIYAPKNDAFHRDKWRDAYDAAALAHFKGLADLGRGVGVNVVYAISPGQDIDAAKPSDVDALVAKISAMATGASIRDAALLMDDLDATAHPHDAALGQAHAALASKLLASMTMRDPAARLWFVPTVYSGLAANLGAGDAAYVAALSALPAGVAIAWTGDGVFSRELKLSDGTAFVALAGRGPKDLWVWDNYPVNDVALFRSLYTRPIVGRESLLPGSGGLVSNPMRHALASIPAMASYAELAQDPAGYAAARTEGRPLTQASLALLLADADAPPNALGTFFAELVHHNTIWPNDYASPALTSAIDAYLSSTSAPAPNVAFDLAARLARLAIVDVDLRRDLDDQALSDELDAHARVTSAIASIAIDAISADRAERLGDAKSASGLRARAACNWLLVNQPTWWTIQKAIERLVPKADTSACAETADPLAAPIARQGAIGQPFAVTLSDAQSEAGAAWAAIGPEGVSISAEGVMQWTPSRLGRYRLVAIRSGNAGAAAKTFDVVVLERLQPESVTIASKGCGCGVVGAAHDGSAFAGIVVALALWIGRRARRLPGCA